MDASKARTSSLLMVAIAIFLVVLFSFSGWGQSLPFIPGAPQLDFPQLTKELSALPSLPGKGLFVAIAAAPAPGQSDTNPPNIARSRTVTIDPTYLSSLTSEHTLTFRAGHIANDARKFVINLFDDVNLTVAKTSSETDDLGNLVIKGIVTGDQLGSVTIVIDHESIVGDAVAGQHRYGFFPIGNSVQRIVEYRDSVIPHLQAPRPPPPPLAPGSQKVAPAPIPGPTPIHLLVVYTKKSSSLFKNISAPISLALADIKTTMSASNINVVIVPVGVSSSDYSEDGKTSSQILEDLRSGVGEFAKIHKLRNDKGADLVSVWADFSDACGLGYENDAIDSGTDGAKYYSAWGYSVLSTHYDTQCAPDLTHEVGHNMGAAHDRYVESGSVPGPKGYNYGYVDLKGEFRDTMAYEDKCKAAGISCPRQQYYSNPDVTFNGRPIGERDSSPDAADAARRIRELAPYVAQFHQFPAP